MVARKKNAAILLEINHVRIVVISSAERDLYPSGELTARRRRARPVRTRLLYRVRFFQSFRDSRLACARQQSFAPLYYLAPSLRH